ncbi:MAG: Nramp family divalent metal transporter [Gammaproteobacteria bacterium]|nr:Nramp family divalent metal transporter [Gammaproteobacteria bacterium]
MSIPTEQLSLPESHRSVAIPEGSSRRRLWVFMGPAFLVAVGYMDPGNWATGLAAGSAYGYALLSVVLIASLMAMVLQVLTARLGIATGQDLAQLCRRRYSPRTTWGLWIMAELAVIATDLAELIGSAIALHLLFGIPMVAGILITVFDVFLLLMLQQKGFRLIEAVVITLMTTISVSFAIELWWSSPNWSDAAAGLMPSTALFSDNDMLYLALGILGATIMPHNLYLHSALVHTRDFASDDGAKREAMRYATFDTIIALTIAFFINAAIVVLAASVFYVNGKNDVAEIQDAYQLLAPMLGASAASTLFAVALLASGQNATLTATLAGQVVMEGFLNIRLPAWKRRLLTRGLAIVPAVLVAWWFGVSGTAQLLVFSQVILSLQLPFALVPLWMMTKDRDLMGNFVNPLWLTLLTGLITSIIIVLNILLLWNFFFE